MTQLATARGDLAWEKLATPRVSIIIVNWNRREDVRIALDCLARVKEQNIEAIVVDNGSTDGSVELFSARKDIVFIPLDRNDGPCRARNIGLQHARAPYVFFLDSDAVLSRDALSICLARMEAEPDVGLIACRIDNIWSRRIDQWIYAAPALRHEHQVFEAYSFSAAGALARRDMLVELGGFDERLRIYNEETDLSIRIIRSGKRLVYDSAARVFHRPSNSGRTPTGDYFRLMIRNWIWIFHRYYPRPDAWKRTLLYAGIYLYKGIRTGNLRACWKGIKEGITGRRAAPPPALSGPRLTPVQIYHIDSLNRRRSVRVERA